MPGKPAESEERRGNAGRQRVAKNRGKAKEREKTRRKDCLLENISFLYKVASPPWI